MSNNKLGFINITVFSLLISCNKLNTSLLGSLNYVSAKLNNRETMEGVFVALILEASMPN